MATKSKETNRIATEIVGTEIRFAFPTPDPEQPYRVAIDAAGLPINIQQYAVLHGIKQKLVDAMAIGVFTDDKGRVRRASIEDKLRAMMAVAKRLQSGEWNEAREGPVGGLLYQAMVRLYPNRWADAAEFRAFIDAQAEKRDVKPSAVETSLRAQPKVAAEIEKIRAEMGKPGIDGDDILAEIE